MPASNPVVLYAHFISTANGYSALRRRCTGSETWNWKEGSVAKDNMQQRIAYNVVAPTLTVLRPDSAKPTGTAVIIAPGGAFHILAVDHEGYDAARWLAKRGVTAFVLKYRLAHSLTDDPAKELNAKFADEAKLGEAITQVLPLCIADGSAAIAWVRSHAKDYGIKPNHIGIAGFSAGGTVTAGTAYNYTKENRPDFAAPIYPFPTPFATYTIPADAPPIFVAVASDDYFKFAPACADLYKNWTAAGHIAELHVYTKGNHGFGMRKQNLPSDKWIEQFYDWIISQGF